MSLTTDCSHRRRPTGLTADLVAMCERQVPDPGPEPGTIYFSDRDYEAAAANLLQEAMVDTIPVFAYGSLLWKPVMEPSAVCRARAHGWHRSFSLRLRRWRGSPDQPGLMMGLRRGGSCVGVVQYFHGLEDRLSVMIRHLRREIGTQGALTGVRWINVSTPEGYQRAITFWAEPTGVDYWVDLPEVEVASILARACGHAGSGASYLYHTVRKLEELGIRDRNLWRLQQLVASEIRGLHDPETLQSDSSM